MTEENGKKKESTEEKRINGKEKSVEVLERGGTQEDLAKLYSKLAKATGEIINVEKNGKNNYHNYKYARADDIYLIVSRILSKYNISVLTFPSKKSINKYKNKKGNLVTEIFLKKYFSFNCGDTGAYIGMSYWGYDRGQGDKFLYKAYTGAMKYFLRDNFMIDTGDPDDPEFGSHTNIESELDDPVDNFISNNDNGNSNDKKGKSKDGDSKKPSKKQYKNVNKQKIADYLKKEEYKADVKEVILEYLDDMGYKKELKSVSQLNNDQLKPILNEIENRISA